MKVFVVWGQGAGSVSQADLEPLTALPFPCLKFWSLKKWVNTPGYWDEFYVPFLASIHRTVWISQFYSQDFYFFLETLFFLQDFKIQNQIFWLEVHMFNQTSGCLGRVKGTS